MLYQLAILALCLQATTTKDAVQATTSSIVIAESLVVTPVALRHTLDNVKTSTPHRTPILGASKSVFVYNKLLKVIGFKI
jgi:hypothetical protein